MLVIAEPESSSWPNVSLSVLTHGCDPSGICLSSDWTSHSLVWKPQSQSNAKDQRLTGNRQVRNQEQKGERKPESYCEWGVGAVSVRRGRSRETESEVKES